MVSIKTLQGKIADSSKLIPIKEHSIACAGSSLMKFSGHTLTCKAKTLIKTVQSAKLLS